MDGMTLNGIVSRQDLTCRMLSMQPFFTAIDRYRAIRRRISVWILIPGFLNIKRFDYDYAKATKSRKRHVRNPVCVCIIVRRPPHTFWHAKQVVRFS